MELYSVEQHGASEISEMKAEAVQRRQENDAHVWSPTRRKKERDRRRKRSERRQTSCVPERTVGMWGPRQDEPPGHVLRTRQRPRQRRRDDTDGMQHSALGHAGRLCVRRGRTAQACAGMAGGKQVWEEGKEGETEESAGP
eukprot:499605-Rhodomonas_salina.2